MCVKQFFLDRPYIENKYHKTSEPFDPYKRRAYHGYDFPDTGLTDGEILQGLEALAPTWADLPHPVAKAKAVSYVLAHTKIDVNAHDRFVGFYSVDRLASHITSRRWERELFTETLPETKALMRDMCRSGAANIWPDFDHVVPDFDALLALGFKGLRERAADYRRQHEAKGDITPQRDAFFRGIDILYDAILRLIDRLYRLATEATHDKAADYAACLGQLRDGAPQDSYQAMQAIYIYFMVSECFDGYQVRSLGNGLDGSLFPFYQRDLASGRYTREEIRELLAYFLMQWSAMGNYWGQPFYMGGTNADGSSKYSDLSRDILAVYDELGIYNPKIQLKINDNTPDDILRTVLDMVRRGHNGMVFCCEPGMTKAVMSYGATAEEARTMDIRGCYETGVRANEVSTVTGYVNALKAVEYVFTDGYEKNIGKRFGAETGALEALTTFDAFYHAVLTQWGTLIGYVLQAADAYEPYLSHINPSLTYSATVEESLRRGEDAYQSGAKFSNSAVLNCGMGSLADAVLAVKELVYDGKITTLTELKAALDADWVGYEALRTKARKCIHKYGNGVEKADRLTEEMAAFFVSRVAGKPNARGGVYKPSMHSAMQFVWQGEKTPATPDGRRAGEEISKNGSPSVGMDKNGVTALIRSALALKPHTYCESFCLDVLLHPSAVAGEEGLAVMKALLMTYLQGDGMSIQFNVFRKETLLDAQKHPERYENLQVRVCGWNVLWNNLSKKEQDAYLCRAAAGEDAL